MMLIAINSVVAGYLAKPPIDMDRRARPVATPAQRSHRTGATPSSFTARVVPHFRQLGIEVQNNSTPRLFVLIPQVGWALRGSKIAFGSQDMFWESGGAYTSAVSAQMLHAAGTHVIIGILSGGNTLVRQMTQKTASCALLCLALLQ